MKGFLFLLTSLIILSCNELTEDPYVEPLSFTGSPPSISLIGGSSINIPIGEDFIEPGFIADDVEDGDLTSSVIVTGSVDTSYANNSVLNYSITDSDGLDYSVYRTVSVSYVGLERSVQLLIPALNPEHFPQTFRLETA
ncbi:MAG: DUF5011 domain-containing protein [Bacteroidales bacterium]|nr:DUF5011 domain-containing protein [Bacteroidales bacterium]